MEQKLRIVKRDGTEVMCDRSKIVVAIGKANAEVPVKERISEYTIDDIACRIEDHFIDLGRSTSVEEVQDMVEAELMSTGSYVLAKAYMIYRYQRAVLRKRNTIDDRIMSLVSLKNEEAKQENSNKNPIINSTQRDYMASEVSEDISRRILLPDDVVKAHDEGIIHFHK